MPWMKLQGDYKKLSDFILNNTTNPKARSNRKFTTTRKSQYNIRKTLTIQLESAHKPWNRDQASHHSKIKKHSSSSSNLWQKNAKNQLGVQPSINLQKTLEHCCKNSTMLAAHGIKLKTIKTYKIGSPYHSEIAWWKFLPFALYQTHALTLAW